jgi:hypothetical protein
MEGVKTCLLGGKVIYLDYILWIISNNLFEDQFINKRFMLRSTQDPIFFEIFRKMRSQEDLL